MKRNLIILMAIACLILGGVCWAGDGDETHATNGTNDAAAVLAPPLASPNINMTSRQLLIALIVPLLIATVKRWIPQDKLKWLPVVAPVIGEILTNLATSLPAGSGALAGLAGVGIREIKDKHFSGDGATGSLGMIALFCGLLFCGAGAGCGHLAPAGVYHGDQALYAADRVIDGAYDALDGFVTWELENRPALAKHPEVTRAADQVRLHAREWVDAALALRDAYWRNPNAETRSQLERGISVLRAALSQVAAMKSDPKLFTSERAGTPDFPPIP